MQLKIGTANYERFTKVPIPLTVKVYLFNISNSEQVLKGLERPQFQEVGPFVYSQWRRREVVDFEDNNRKIRYREYKTYYSMYDPSKSEWQQVLANGNTNSAARHNSDNNNNSNDAEQQQQQQAKKPVMLDPTAYNVTIVNLPLLSALTKLAQLEEGSLKRSLAAQVVKRLLKDGREKILTTRPVNQLLFDGYRVDYLESARELVSDFLGFNFESPLPKNKFGFFYGKNGTWSRRDNGELTVYTGRNGSMGDFMIIENWNDQRELNVWPKNTKAGNRCNQIRGTDGSQFHPGVNRQQVLQLFSPMVCTSLYIKYKEDTEVRGIPLLRFTTPPDVFGAPKKNPHSSCYCTVQSQTPQSSMMTDTPLMTTTTGATTTTAAAAFQTTLPPATMRKINDSRCYLDGLMDLSLCQRGAPIAASSPHFYNADPMLAMATGLKPNKEIHETYLDIEPMTGSVFRAASRAQINAFVEQAALEVVESSIIGHMTPMVAPLLWIEETASIDEKSSIEFKNKLLNTVQRLNRTCRYLIIFGVLLALVVSIQFIYVTCYSIDSEEIRKKQEAAAMNKRGRPRRNSNSRGRQFEENLRSASGARKSNLAAKASRSPLLGNGTGTDDDTVGTPSPSSSKTIPITIATASTSRGNSGGKRNRPPLERKDFEEDEDVEDYAEDNSMVESARVRLT